jgi:CYTH domain-containing protein
MSDGSIIEKSTRRRFLVDVDKFEDFLTSEGCLNVCEIRQFYLVFKNGRAACLQETHFGGCDSTTVRSGATPFDLDEFEFRAHGDEYMEKRGFKSGAEVRRSQYEVEFEDREWSVNLFDDDLEGLTLATIAGPDVAEITSLPSWVEAEVTHDSRYRSAWMAMNGRPE